MVFERARETRKVIHRLSIAALLFGQVRALGMQQSAAIDQPEAQARFGLGQTIRDHGFAKRVGNTDARGTRAQHHNVLIAEAAARDADRRKDGAGGDGSRALNIVVEGNELIAIAVQDWAGVRFGKVLPLKERVRELLFHGLNETIDEIIVFVTGDSFVAPSEVLGIGEALLIVGSHVENDGQSLRGRDASNQSVERELADRDAESANSLVPNAKNALAVGDDNDADLLVGAIAEQGPDVIAHRVGNDDPTGTAVNVAEFLAGLRDYGRVDDGKHFLDVVEEQAVEQNFVGVLELAQVDVALEIVRFAKKSLVGPKRLFLDGFHGGRQEAV